MLSVTLACPSSLVLLTGEYNVTSCPCLSCWQSSPMLLPSIWLAKPGKMLCTSCTVQVVLLCNVSGGYYSDVIVDVDYRPLWWEWKSRCTTFLSQNKRGIVRVRLHQVVNVHFLFPLPASLVCRQLTADGIISQDDLLALLYMLTTKPVPVCCIWWYQLLIVLH